MKFVDRFQCLQTQRDHDEELIKVRIKSGCRVLGLYILMCSSQDILMHYKDVEQDAQRLTKELQNHKQLAQELQDTQLDLEDSNRSRRDLQQRLKATTQMLEQFKGECDQMRVCTTYIGLGNSANNWQNRNAYVMVLVDGDGMIVRDRPTNQNSIC